MTCLRAFVVFSLCVLLAACSSGPPRRVYPPQATVQELRVQADGQVAATLRIQNFSTVPMTFTRLQATLTLAAGERHGSTSTRRSPSAPVRTNWSGTCSRRRRR